MITAIYHISHITEDPFMVRHNSWKVHKLRIYCTLHNISNLFYVREVQINNISLLIFMLHDKQ